MAIADVGLGAQIGLKQLLLQRMAAQQYADHMRQQDFENQRQLAGDQRADRQLEETAALRQAAQGDLAQQRTFGEANALADQIPGDTFLGEQDPAAATMQKGGRGALLTKTPEVKPMGPEFQGPMQGGVSPQQAQVGRPGGFLKTRSAKQVDTEADNARQADAERRSEAAQRSTEAYQQGMLGVAKTNANTKGAGKFTFVQTYGADGKPGPVVRANAETGEVEPVNMGGAMKPPTAAAAGADAAAAAKASEVQGTLDLITEIEKDPALSTAVGPIASHVGIVVDPTGVTRFQNKQKELLGKLQLAQAGKLKGQGQISDKERQILREAVTALSQSMGEKDYRAELQKIRTGLSGGGNGPGGGTIRARDAQGALHEAPAGTALPAGWTLER